MFRGSRGTQNTSLRVSVNPQSIQRGGEVTYRVPRIDRVSNSDEGRLAERRVDLLARDRERLTRHLQGEPVQLATEPSAVSCAEAIAVCVPTLS